MEEGSMRCDANISVRLRGENPLGIKVEVKNLNSIRNVKKAIDFEINRLTSILENGEKVIQQTRSFDASNGTTFSLRDKEEANDYRYFPEPDLTPFLISEEKIETIKKSLPELPAALEKKFTEQYNLPLTDARVLCDDRETASFFQSIIKHMANYKAVANWVIGPVKSYINESNISIEELPISPETFARLIEIVENGSVSFGMAATKIFPALLKFPEKEPIKIAEELNVILEKNDDSIHAWVDEVLSKMPDKVQEYKKGRKSLIGLFSGEVKKISKGKADMKTVNQILNQKLN